MATFHDTRRYAAALLLLSSAACLSPRATPPAGPVPAGTPSAPAPSPAPPQAPAPAPAPTGPELRRAAIARIHEVADSIVTAPDFANARWGLLVFDPATGDTLYSHDAGKLFMPASNMKLVTSTVAMTQLGADYRFPTVLAARGRVKAGVLHGDLLVIGSGDPSVSDHMLGDAMIPLRAMADSLAARGIKRIAGRVLAYGDAFPGPNIGYGWSWDDLGDSYSARVDELEFNEGFSVVHVKGATRAGRTAIVTTTPATHFPLVRNRARTVAAGGETKLTVVKDTTTGYVVVTGTIGARDSAAFEVTHFDPDAAYVEALREATRARGIGISWYRADTTAKIDTLVTWQSPTLAEILPALLKPSQNQVAEALFRAAAIRATGSGSADSARANSTRQLVAWGARPDGFVLRDGSGLSRYNYLSPETLLHVLEAARRLPPAAFQAWYDALPVAGVDGTLDNRMKGTPAEGNVHAKTGTISNARSLSGFVTTADGQRLEFVMLGNNYTTPTSEVSRAQDVLAATLASLRLR